MAPQELAAVVGFTHRAGRDRDYLIHAMRLGETAELRQHLKGRVHRLAGERPPVESACAQPDHFLLTVDDLERQIGADPHHDHVQGVGSDVDGGKLHHGWAVRNVVTIMASGPIMTASTRHDDRLAADSTGLH